MKSTFVSQIMADNIYDTSKFKRECRSWLPRLPVYLESHHQRNTGLQAQRGNAHDRYAVDLHVLQISVYRKV